MLNVLKNALDISQRANNLDIREKEDEINTLLDAQKMLLNKASQLEMPTDEQIVTEIAETLQQIETINRVIESEAQQLKNEVYGKIKTSNKSKRMNKAYGN